jgi:hypothetical protein
MRSPYCGALALGFTAAALALAAVPAVAADSYGVGTTSRTNLNTNNPGTMGIPQPEPLITLSIKQPRSVARVLSEIFKQVPGDEQYQLLADVGTTAFTLEANKEPLTKVLTNLFAQEKRPDPLVYSFQRSLTGKGGTFVIDREYIEIGVIDGEKKVSLANARITKVLPELFKLMGVQGRVEPDVPPVTVSLQVRPDDWSPVLPMLMIEAYKKEPFLTYSKDGSTWVVHIQRTLTGGPGSPLPSGSMPRKVKANFNETPLPDALAELFQGSAWKYQISDSIPKTVRVTYATANEPELAALNALLRSVAAQGSEQITYREGKGVLYIEPGPLPGQYKVVSKNPTVPRTSLTTKLKLRQITDLVGGALGTKITVAPNVPDIPVSVKLVDATIDDAIKAIVSSAKESLPNIGYKVVGNGYQIELTK